MSRIAALVFALFMAGLVPASAQQNAAAPILPSHLAVATDVLKASGMITMFQNSMPNVIGGIRVNATRQRPELAKDIEASIAELEKQIPDLMQDGVATAGRFLAARMSEDELKLVNTFLNSPAGKKYVEVLPGFMEEVVPFLEEWNRIVTQAIGRAFSDEMIKRGHKL